MINWVYARLDDGKVIYFNGTATTSLAALQRITELARKETITIRIIRDGKSLLRY